MQRANRREFLGASAAAGAMALGAGLVRAAEPKVLKLGVIGVGWYGMVDARPR